MSSPRPRYSLQPFQIGAILAALAVVFGAFGAHVLKAQLSPNMLANVETGVRYQMYAALALMLLGQRTHPTPHPTPMRAPLLLLAGAVVFSGSLYLMALSGWRWLGAITPIGGALLIAGFLWAAWEYRGGSKGSSDQLQ